VTNRSYDQVYTVRADATGALTGSAVALTATSRESKAPALGFDGTNLGLAWQDDRNEAGAFEIYFQRASTSGTALGSPVRLTTAAGSSRIPALSWGGTQWGVAWEDVRDGDFEIYFTRVSAAGVEVGDDVRVTTSAGMSSAPALGWSGTHWGLAWDDERDGNREIYFVTIASDGTVGTAVRVTEDSAVSADPSIVWNGTGWLVVWRDGRDGNEEIYAVRLDADGNRIGDDSRLTTSDGASMHPDLVWTGTEYAIAYEEIVDPVALPNNAQPRFLRFTCP
jgi:hypothetical protein